MLDFSLKEKTISLNFNFKKFEFLPSVIEKYMSPLLVLFLSLISIFSFYFYFNNGLGLSYNDARSHLDIGRRVVEGLKPGFAQLGSVWLPLPHILMVPTIWNDFMWICNYIQNKKFYKIYLNFRSNNQAIKTFRFFINF
jgi:hypothetical protein